MAATNCTTDDKSDSRLYIGNIDQRITEAHIIKMFSPFGKVVAEDFLWHTRGPRRGEPRGFAFIQYSTREEARLAQEKMHGRLACGRPLVVRFAGEKLSSDASASSTASSEWKRPSCFSNSSSAPITRASMIETIKTKLKSMEEDNGRDNKRRR